MEKNQKNHKFIRKGCHNYHKPKNRKKIHNNQEERRNIIRNMELSGKDTKLPGGIRNYQEKSIIIEKKQGIQ